jgi:CheY-like chemotaxis protein
VAHILVIDDDEEICRMLQELLSSEGHEVDIANGGQEGIDHYRRLPSDLVITDIFMPEKDGLDAIRELRSQRSDVKIIAITGFPVGQRQGYLELAEDLGAARTFTKPFDTRALVEAVRELVAG